MSRNTGQGTSLPLRTGWLARLGLIGLQALEAPLLAALATELPLLLIGPHGTAKSLLLTRVAQALELSCRHYNASLLNFDDLVGFPVPGPDRTLEYLQTPASIWGAGAVIFDEISRCRPDIQNKLFPIIHERRVQGLLLDSLRHRWAAMNPPCTDDDDNGYAGSEPLDRALADRFPFVVCMPAWEGFAEADRLAVIRAGDCQIAPGDARLLRALLTETRALLPVLEDEAGTAVAQYVHALLPLLAQAGLALSPRRANLVYRAVLAVGAAAQAMDTDAPMADTAWQALSACLPQRAEGIAVPDLKLLAAHREAMRTLVLAPHDPLRRILATADPLERLRLALRARRLPRAEFSRIVADTLAQMPHGAREAATAHLFETAAVGRLNAAVASQAGEVYRDLAEPPAFSEGLHATQPRFATWTRLKQLLSTLDPAEPQAHLQANAMARLFAKKHLQTPQDAERAFEAFATTDQCLRSA